MRQRLLSTLPVGEVCPVPSLFRSGLIISSSIEVEKLRRIPPTGQVLVPEGELVDYDQVVGHMNPQGYVVNINLASEINVSPFDVPESMLVPVGTAVRRGEIIATNRTFYSLREYSSPEDGILEHVSPYTGRVRIRAYPLAVRAMYPGIVRRIVPGEGVVITSQGALLQGIFGIGPYQAGRLAVVTRSEAEPLIPELIKPEHEGCIIAAGGAPTVESLDRAKRLGVRAIIVGGIHKAVLDTFLGYSLGTAVTGLEKTVTLVVTEGFGRIPMLEASFALLNSLHGCFAIVNGATQVRAGVIRPELFVPHPGLIEARSKHGQPGLKAGQLVRLIRRPRFGQLAVIIDATSFPQRLASGVEVLAVKVRVLPTGQDVVVPVANLEAIG